MAQNIIPDEEMLNLAKSSLQYANGYYNTFQRCINNNQSRFNNDLLYQMAVMSVEKYFIALLARYDWNASHHMPVAMYNEALQFEPELTEDMKKTTILVGKFEAICSLEGFGYRAPSIIELQEMSKGISNIRALVEKRIAEVI
ncbi:conserved hypothetical protein [uncultured Paludibacter sp.]|uniref:HEPN domain-containing protein n=1 Tax=uncultured Paludibacter sp. TaxID=497635 RepID=A0A653A9N4_9BACT|nr:conserved hypothetical protein [uncultured Paludibacter sp.]